MAIWWLAWATCDKLPANVDNPLHKASQQAVGAKGPLAGCAQTNLEHFHLSNSSDCNQDEGRTLVRFGHPFWPLGELIERVRMTVSTCFKLAS